MENTHEIYPTSALLYKMKIKQSDLCLTCHEVDTLDHFFFSCSRLNNFWLKVSDTINSHIGKRVNIDADTVIFGLLDIEQISKAKVLLVNHILLIAKHSISKYKYGSGGALSIIFENEMSIRHIDI